MFAFPILTGHFWEHGLREHIANVAAVLSDCGLLCVGAFVIGGALYSVVCGLVFGFLSSVVPQKLLQFSAWLAPPTSGPFVALSLSLGLGYFVAVIAITYWLAMVTQAIALFPV